MLTSLSTLPTTSDYENEECVQKLLSYLDPRHKAFIKQRYLFGLSAKEIAERHGITEALVHRELRNAERIMRRFARQMGILEGDR